MSGPLGDYFSIISLHWGTVENSNKLLHCLYWNISHRIKCNTSSCSLFNGVALVWQCDVTRHQRWLRTIFRALSTYVCSVSSIRSECSDLPTRVRSVIAASSWPVRDCPHSGFWSSIFGVWTMYKKSRCRSSCEFTTRGWRRTDLLYNWAYLVSTQLYRRSVRLQPRVVNSQDDRQRLFYTLPKAQIWKTKTHYVDSP